jgi:hypothetical protein
LSENNCKWQNSYHLRGRWDTAKHQQVEGEIGIQFPARKVTSKLWSHNSIGLLKLIIFTSYIFEFTFQLGNCKLISSFYQIMVHIYENRPGFQIMWNVNSDTWCYFWSNGGKVQQW